MSPLAQALATGELRVLGRLPDASNVALLCEVTVEARVHRCIYKPRSGERPLWDFPGAVLSAREVLAVAVARCFGWDLVPETAWRDDGPVGPGMCQEWITAAGPAPVGLFASDETPPGWCAVAEGRTPDGGTVVLAHEDTDELKRVALLDALINNADRKGGHVLRRSSGGLAGIDHGVSFHVEPKLRTVLWGWAGQAIPEHLLSELTAGAEEFGYTLVDGAGELGRPEVAAAHDRLERLLVERTFPMPGEDWPALPWPPL